MTEQLANDAQSTLTAGINASVTVLSVVDPSQFPGSPSFRLLIDSEYLLVTAIPGAYTVTRGIEGSTAASHAAGATVTHVLTAGGLTQFVADNAGGTTALYVQEDAPAGDAGDPWQWWELNPDQSLKTLWVNVP